MLESKPASKESINSLIINSGRAIDELYKELKGELTVRALMDENTPDLYVLTQDLQNGIKFILMDMGTSCRAEFSTKNLYEKRFHLKNIQASISEGYKLLFNFGKLRKKSLWRKLVDKLQKEGNTELITECRKIETKLDEYGNTEINQSLRNITLHYDKEMIEVYQMTISVDSEEVVMKKACAFWGILQDVCLFADKVDLYCLAKTRIRKPFPSFKIQLDINPFHQVVCKLINKNGEFENVISEFHPEAIENIDSMANLWRSIKRIEEYIHTHNNIADKVPEIGYIQVLTNIQMLLRFMMLDIIAIVDAYIKSASNIEYALNFRRVCVIKVSTMVHLRGYNKDEYEQSIWKLIKEITPSIMQDDVNKIGIILDEIVKNAFDKDLRNAFVHLFNNSNACIGINDAVNAIERINPMTQVVEIHLLLDVYKLLIRFTTKLMNVLSEDAHKETLKSNKVFNDSITDFIQIIAGSGMPDDQKKQLIDKINHIRWKINDLML